jgi:hypothetical protein
MVLERWGMAETTPEALPDIEVEQPTAESAAEEDALLNQWSDDLDQALGLSVRPAAQSARPATLPAGAIEAERAASTDAPERWSAPHLAGEAQVSTPIVHDDDAPLSAAELSLLDQWSSEDPAQPAAAISDDKIADDTRRSSRPPGRTLPPPLRSMRPPLPPRAAAALATQTAEPLDVELEEEIELEPDDLIEID